MTRFIGLPKSMSSRLSRHVRNHRAGTGVLYRIAQRYIRHYSNQSVDPALNGEYALIDRLAPLGFATILDVGANDGDHAAILRRIFPDAQIHMFEIDSDIFTGLAARFADDPHARAVNIGLGAENGEHAYFFNRAGNHSGTTMFYDKDVRPNAYDHERRVARIRTGDDWCAETGIAAVDFLKIDTEGADFSVMQGFAGMLAARSVRLVQFEYNFHAFNARVFFHDIHRLLKAHGYEIGRIYPRGAHFSPYSIRSEGQAGMYVACHESDHDLKARIGYAPPALA
ncbi:FkbM family methyltransferase [Meridianimarinicoccus sp. RP-17]|uniref:FkbM family methyltransferase n=1 Tax=Meridianimarinicoccus zhengii TaxID=2056810 RepID=UPI0013A6C4A8|nr:FkbM family methyltransferase [Phycocomes zhengii]